MTDDFIRYGTIGGAYAGNPKEIASIFENGNVKQRIYEPLILTYLNGREEKWPKALDYIKFYIDLLVPILIPPVRLVDGNNRRRRAGNARTRQCHQIYLVVIYLDNGLIGRRTVIKIYCKKLIII